MHQAILLPGGVLPKNLAYKALVEALGADTHAVTKDLEIYATDAPPRGYGLELETAGVLSAADAAGFARFHLVGYSAGGAVAIAFTASHPQRVLSLALLEPAWMGNEEQSDDERAVRRQFARIARLPADEFMREFVRAAIAPGVVAPAPPAGPQPQWMAKRPAGLKALIRAFEEFPLDLEAVKAFSGPVYYVAGELSNPRFDPPHRAEPVRLARGLTELWDRAERPAGVPRTEQDVLSPDGG